MTPALLSLEEMKAIDVNWCCLQPGVCFVTCVVEKCLFLGHTMLTTQCHACKLDMLKLEAIAMLRMCADMPGAQHGGAPVRMFFALITIMTNLLV
jgi:hypothetical protein